MQDVNVGSRIREARDTLNLSQHELAERVGVSQRAVSYVEKQALVKRSTLEKYAQALGRALSYFLLPYSGEEGSVIVQRVLDNPDAQVGFNAAIGKYENMIEAGVIDPLMVTRSALENAASIASMIMTTEGLMAEVQPEDDYE